MRRLRSASEVQDLMSLRPYNTLFTFLVTFVTCGRQDKQESKVIPRLTTSSTKGTQAPLSLTTILEIFNFLNELTVVEEPKTIACVFFVFIDKLFASAHAATFMACSERYAIPCSILNKWNY